MEDDNLKDFKPWEKRQACALRKKDWINKDATVNEAIKTRYDELEGASAKIDSCLGSIDKRTDLMNIRQLSRQLEDRNTDGQMRIKRSALDKNSRVRMKGTFLNEIIFVFIFIFLFIRRKEEEEAVKMYHHQRRDAIPKLER